MLYPNELIHKMYHNVHNTRFSCLRLKSKSQTAMRQTLPALSNLVLQSASVLKEFVQMDSFLMMLFFSKPSNCVNFFTEAVI